MRSIRKTDTKPEVRVRSVLHRNGLRFRLHRRDLPGVPDIVLPRYRVALFVHGCFWHQHTCHLGKLPKSNLEYWLPKLRRNQERHTETERVLRSRDWTVVVIWECETKTTEEIERVLADRMPLAVSLRLQGRVRRTNQRSGRWDDEHSRSLNPAPD